MTLKRREMLIGMAFIMPFMIGFLIFYLIPFVISVIYSFTSGIGGMEMVGLQNYQNVFKSYAFQLAAKNTFRFMGIGIPLLIFVSLSISLLIYGTVGKTKIFQLLFLYPMIVPLGSVVMFFQIMLSKYGVLNQLLYRLGLPESDWMGSGKAFYALLFLYIWKNCGYNMILLLTGLNNIPKECEEAAHLDGADWWKYFRYVQWPLLLPNLLFVFVMSVINSFKCYREAFLLGGRYPNDSIYMLQHFMNNNFESLNYQRLSVAAFLVFIVIVFLVIILFIGKAQTEKDGTEIEAKKQKQWEKRATQLKKARKKWRREYYRKKGGRRK